MAARDMLRDEPGHEDSISRVPICRFFILLPCDSCPLRAAFLLSE